MSVLKQSFVGALVPILALAFVVLAGAMERPTPVQAQEAKGCEGQRDSKLDVYPRCLVIIKETDPSGSNQHFDFDIDGDLSDSFSLQDGDAVGYLVEVDFKQGAEITISEDVPNGWSLSISCPNAGFTVLEEDDESVTISYDGEGDPFSYMECTFTNTREDQRERDFVDTGGRFIGGGLFLGIDTAQQNRARANAAAPVATPRPAEPIRPPSTGDGGLLP